VSDVAEVREGTLDRTTLISGSGEPAAVVNVSRQIGGNILQIGAVGADGQPRRAALGGEHLEKSLDPPAGCRRDCRRKT